MTAAFQFRLLILASQIQDITSKIVENLIENQLQEPTFDVSSEPLLLTPENVRLKEDLNDTAQDLLRLVNGPKTDLSTSICTIYDLAAWQVAFEFRLFEAILENGAASLHDIARKVSVDEDRVRRILKILATDRMFEEVEKDHFKHTSRRVLYARYQQVRDLVHYQLDEYFAAAPELSNSIRASPMEAGPIGCAFHRKHGKEVFQFYQEDPKRGARFASAMAGYGTLEKQFDDLKDSYAWSNVKDGRLIDIGGGRGHVTIALARAFPNLEVLVQDSITMISQVDPQTLGDLQGRFAYMEHSFFEPQPVAGAAAYFIRLVTHNWNDESVIRIFKSMVPALERSKPRTPFLINDIILPEWNSGSSRFEEHRLRQIDIMMMTVLGSKQCTESEFSALLQEADPRLKINSIRKGRSLSSIEVFLHGNE